VPVVSFFFGIIIRMYFREHNPPHFHAYYGGKSAIINIQTLNVMEGDMSNRPLKFVLEWAEIHQEELLENWEMAQNRFPPKKIKPLED
jgi:hypothetical protein